MPAASLGLSANELLSYLSRSELPTLLVEGKGDRAILRRFEQSLAAENVDVLPVGGKLVLQEVYERRLELSGAKVVFMRDRDEYCVIVPPDGFSDYVMTSGYSLENDILDRETINRLAGDTSVHLATSISLYSTWFRARLQNYVLVNSALSLSDDVSTVIVSGVLAEGPAMEVAQTVLVSPFDELEVDVSSWTWVRGKSLLRVVHSHFQGLVPTYSASQLLDLCVKMGPSLQFRDLVERVAIAFR